MDTQHTATNDVILITTDCLGTGVRELGEILMKSFLNKLCDAELRPARIILINDGVRLATEGSKVLEPLAFLEKEGVSVLSCGTCLEYYKLKDKLKVGQVTTMDNIVSYLLTASKVIKI
ncbi:sulfurtransferase-like selenium metabolism protein YedF [Chloroflexota bacterium]